MNIRSCPRPEAGYLIDDRNPEKTIVVPGWDRPREPEEPCFNYYGHCIDVSSRIEAEIDRIDLANDFTSQTIEDIVKRAVKLCTSVLVSYMDDNDLVIDHSYDNLGLIVSYADTDYHNNMYPSKFKKGGILDEEAGQKTLDDDYERRVGEIAKKIQAAAMAELSKVVLFG